MLNGLDRYCCVEDFVPLVDFLGVFMGKDCEVVLHDTNNLERSVVAIANGHITGRRIGAPLTDLALKIVKDRQYENVDYVMDYETTSREGKPLRSATFFLKDKQGELQGMLCLNMDMSKLVDARDLLNKVIRAGKFDRRRRPKKEAASAECFHASIEDLTMNMVRDVLSGYDVPPERLTPAEKMNIVAELNRRGVFLIKGAVAVVAANLAASEATIYRYLNKS